MALTKTRGAVPALINVKYAPFGISAGSHRIQASLASIPAPLSAAKVKALNSAASAALRTIDDFKNLSCHGRRGRSRA
jgi:hypothetical protein